MKTLIKFLKRKLIKERPFTTSKDYWNHWYKKGGDSGPGSYNRLAEFKAEIINDFVARKDVKTVMEMGCGDGNQLSYFNFSDYVGLDISDVILEKCRSKYRTDSSKRFYNMSEVKNHSAELVLSLDVIYHLIEDDVYNEYMQILFERSEKYVGIYADNGEDDGTYAPHVKPRKFISWVTQNQHEYKLIEHIPNKYPYDRENPDNTSISDFFFFEKR